MEINFQFIPAVVEYFDSINHIMAWYRFTSHGRVCNDNVFFKLISIPFIVWMLFIFIKKLILKWKI